MTESTEQECRRVIKEWLEEMSEELEFLTKRKAEVEKEMEEFQKRTTNEEEEGAKR
jgi:prefoldin subunit 5